jgi:hypothetical protein
MATQSKGLPTTMTGDDSTQADERTEHEALAAERSRIIRQREHRAARREEATSGSERHVAEVLEKPSIATWSPTLGTPLPTDATCKRTSTPSGRRQRRSALRAETFRKSRDASREDRSAAVTNVGAARQLDQVGTRRMPDWAYAPCLRSRRRRQSSRVPDSRANGVLRGVTTPAPSGVTSPSLRDWGRIRELRRSSNVS